MQWARVGDGDIHSGTRSARSLLTVTTHVTVAGMVGDLIVERGSITTSGVIGVTATSTASVVEIEIGIGNTIDGVTGDRHS